MAFQETSTQRGVRKVESSTSQRLTPFAEIAKWMFGVPIQGTSVRNCSAALLRSNEAARPTETMKIASELPSANARLPWDEDRGMASAIRNAARGRKRTTVSRFIAEDLPRGPWPRSAPRCRREIGRAHV